MEVFIRMCILILTPILALVVGSFLNVAIYRIPLDMSLSTPRSHCPKCNEPIKWYDNIPVISYLILRGKCRHCHEPISFRYPLVELLNCLAWVICMMMFTDVVFVEFKMQWLRFIFSCIASSALICIFFTDLDHMEIPEVFQLIVLICGLVILMEDISKENVINKVVGFLACGGIFYIVNLIYKLIKKKDGIGFGDVELVAVAGLLIGGYNMLFGLLLSCTIGLLIMLIVMKIRKGKEFPFAVILVPGIFVAMFVGDFVTNWYLALLGVH